MGKFFYRVGDDSVAAHLHEQDQEKHEMPIYTANSDFSTNGNRKLIEGVLCFGGAANRFIGVLLNRRVLRLLH